MFLVYWRREKNDHSESSELFILTNCRALCTRQFCPIFYSSVFLPTADICLSTQWVVCCCKSHIWMRKRKNIRINLERLNTHTSKVHTARDGRAKQAVNCKQISKRPSKKTWFQSSLEELHCPNWVFQSTITIRLLVCLMFYIKYWETNNENYSCKIYTKEVSANIRVENGKEMLAIDLQVLLPSGLRAG